MSGDRSKLQMPKLGDDLDDFAPKPAAASSIEAKKEVDKVSNFPSREAAIEGQLNMKGSKAILDRFKTMCKDDRRSYVAMLEILMDKFEGKGQGG